MGETLAVPVWLALPAALLAAWAAYDKLVMPALRWMLARPANQVIDELSTRLLPAHAPAGAHPPADDGSEGTAGCRAPCQGARHRAAEGHSQGRALRARDRPGLQRLRLLQDRLLVRTQAGVVALPGGARLDRHPRHRGVGIG